MPTNSKQLDTDVEEKIDTTHTVSVSLLAVTTVIALSAILAAVVIGIFSQS